MLPLFSWDDVAYVIYDTAGRVSVASEYGRHVYANGLKGVLSNTTSCEETILRVLSTVRRRGTLFDVVGFQQRFHKTLFVVDDTYLTLFCQHVQFPFVQHMDIIKYVVFIMIFLCLLSVFLA